MPLYDYECQDCGSVTEVKRRMSDTSKFKCPECGSTKTFRHITGGLMPIVQRDATTIGQLADRNAKKNASKIQEQEAKKEESMTPEQREVRDTRKQVRKINRMTAEQKHEYIMKGE